MVATAHPVAEAWARLLPSARAAAEQLDVDGIIGARKWYDELLRPEEKHDGVDEEAEMAKRFLSWDTAQAVLDKIEWLDTDEGRRLARRVWRDSRRQPYGLVHFL